MSNYFHAIYGQGGSPAPAPKAPVLLWENSDPTSAFEGQTISLDLEGYEGVIVECYPSLSNQSVRHREYIKKSDTQGSASFTVGATDSTTYCGGRHIYLESDGVTIGNGYQANGSEFTLTNEYYIPVRIYGVQDYVVEEETSAPELLWSNPNPTSEFLTQTIELDLSEYEGVLIEANDYKTTPTLISRLYVKKGENLALGRISTTSSTPSGTARRVNVTESGITFATAFSNDEWNNNSTIPVKIYGVKKHVVEYQIKGFTKLNYNLPISYTATDTLTIDIRNDYPNYGNLTMDNIMVQLNNAGAGSSDMTKFFANISYSYSNGIITLKSDSTYCPFRTDTSRNISVTVGIA